jgi:hypothetical protein
VLLYGSQNVFNGVNKYQHKVVPGLDKFWVIAVISNPQRYKSRYNLYEKFKASMEVAGVNLLTVEIALGQRPFELTEENNPNHVQLRTNNELWHKEQMINIGISRLPQDWEYVAWIDADVEFCRQDWAAETVEQLQHYDVVQLFQSAIDLGPEGEVITVFNGFVHSWMNEPNINNPLLARGKYGLYWHPGFAWAATRKAINDLGGLIDWAILGSADHHMAWAFIGKVADKLPKNIAPAYKRELETWQLRATHHIKQNIGYVPGTIYHHFHGKKKNRKYVERWDILLKHDFNPDKDLKRDWQGLWQFTEEGLRLRNDIRNYFRQRNEDSIDL